MGRGQGQGSQAGTSGTQGRVYAVTPSIANLSVIQGMFLLSRLWERVLFDFGASNSFIVVSCVKELGLEVETLEKPLHVRCPLGTRVIFVRICQDCKLGISRILLTMYLRVMDMLDFDVILGMD